MPAEGTLLERLSEGMPGASQKLLRCRRTVSSDRSEQEGRKARFPRYDRRGRWIEPSRQGRSPRRSARCSDDTANVPGGGQSDDRRPAPFEDSQRATCERRFLCHGIDPKQSVRCSATTASMTAADLVAVILQKIGGTPIRALIGHHRLIRLAVLLLNRSWATWAELPLGMTRFSVSLPKLARPPPTRA
jgi:hypothetical protein